MAKRELVWANVEAELRKAKKPPTIAECCRLLDQPNVQGSQVDWLCSHLVEYAQTQLSELVQIFPAQSRRVQLLIMGAIVQARNPAAEAFLIEQLQSSDQEVRNWARQGLITLDTKTARRIVWSADHESA